MELAETIQLLSGPAAHPVLSVKSHRTRMPWLSSIFSKIIGEK